MSDPFVIQNQDNSIKENRLENYFSRGLEGDFLFGLGEDSGSLRFSINKKKIFLLFGAIVVCLLVLLVRLFYLQITQGSYFRNIAEGNRIRIKPVRASRGVIIDRDNRLLVRNISRFSLFFIPADLPQDEIELNRVLSAVARVLGKSVEELKILVEQSWKFSYEPVLMKEDVPYEQAVLLEIESANLAGVFLERVPRRQYIETGGGLSHILGYTGKLTADEYEALKDQGYLINDDIGKTGVEKTYELFLRGKYGLKKVEVDFLGKEEKILSTLESERGQDLILSIDFDLQKKANEFLRDYGAKFKAGSGTVIIANVNTGELLALVSWPDYDNNLFAAGISIEDYQALTEDANKPFINRAISGEYPPGSTFKLVEAAGALEEGIINEKTQVFSTGGIKIGEWFYPDWKAGGHGRVTVTEAIAESVNTFFYYIGGGYEDFKGLGLERISYWAYLFGLGQESGIDLIGEEDGFLPTKQWKMKYKGKPWYIGDTYHLAIGQGDILVTPLQVLNFTTAIANGGILYQPRVVLGLVDRSKKEKFLLEPKIIRKYFVSDNNLGIVREGMREAVIYGSLQGLNSLPVEVAGKTGTAQIGGDKEPHAWFTGFAPYREPEIAVTVLVENGGEGSRVAASIGREIFKYYFENKD